MEYFHIWCVPIPTHSTDIWAILGCLEKSWLTEPSGQTSFCPQSRHVIAPAPTSTKGGCRVTATWASPVVMGLRPTDMTRPSLCNVSTSPACKRRRPCKSIGLRCAVADWGEDEDEWRHSRVTSRISCCCCCWRWSYSYVCNWRQSHTTQCSYANFLLRQATHNAIVDGAICFEAVFIHYFFNGPS